MLLGPCAGWSLARVRATTSPRSRCAFLPLYDLVRRTDLLPLFLLIIRLNACHQRAAWRHLEASLSSLRRPGVAVRRLGRVLNPTGVTPIESWGHVEPS